MMSGTPPKPRLADFVKIFTNQHLYAMMMMLCKTLIAGLVPTCYAQAELLHKEPQRCVVQAQHRDLHHRLQDGSGRQFKCNAVTKADFSNKGPTCGAVIFCATRMRFSGLHVIRREPATGTRIDTACRTRLSMAHSCLHGFIC